MAATASRPRSKDAASLAQLPAIRSSDRACFFGATGSGKTTLMRAYLQSYAGRYAVLDAKHTFRVPGAEVVPEFDPRKRAEVVRDRVERSDGQMWERALYGAWKQRNRLVCVDEITMVNRTRGDADYWFGTVVRTGRERNVGMLLGTQRPALIPTICYTEAQHFFVFSLQWKDDRKKVAEFTGDAMLSLLAQIEGHQFVYYKVGTKQPVIMEMTLRTKGAE